jgi:hypothetical protein
MPAVSQLDPRSLSPRHSPRWRDRAGRLSCLSPARDVVGWLPNKACRRSVLQRHYARYELSRRFGFFAKVDAHAKIRTAAEIPVEVGTIDHADLPVYLKIAEKAKHLRELGMSDRAIPKQSALSTA